jgi:hypothetical protein
LVYFQDGEADGIHVYGTRRRDSSPSPSPSPTAGEGEGYDDHARPIVVGVDTKPEIAGADTRTATTKR